MEVHANTHTVPDPGPSTSSGHPGRKRWTHYFWEFLMLFLAVFCGFLAEYQLEHKIEKDREKIYINNLYEDLKSDTSIYIAYEKSGAAFADNIDSLMRLLNSPNKSTQLDKIYFLARFITLNSNIINPNQRTYTQMKNSGLLRLITRQKVAENVSAYYLALDEILSQNDFILNRIAAYWDEVGNLFDAEILYRIRIEKKVPDIVGLKLMTNDPVVINKFLVNVQYFFGSRMKQNEAITQRSQSAKELMLLIKKEYHL